MDPKFKPYRTGMLTVKEKYVCGRGVETNKRCYVYYLCQCDCGKEVVFSGEEIAKHPYSCGCTPKPAISLTPGPKNRYSLGYTDGIDAVEKKHQSILVNLLIGACVGPGELNSVGRLLDVEPDALPFVLDDLHRPSFRSAEGVGAAGLGLPYQF